MGKSSRGRLNGEARSRRRRRQEIAEARLVVGFLRERGSRRVQRSTEAERMEVLG
ncbi:MAG: hypothetical protein J2P28_17735 [Actinobacteria bacterium]|nr:hypothetical protein [Actinomycetota bacterium]